MPKISQEDVIELQPDQRDRIYRRTMQGAILQSGAALFMWAFALAAYLAGLIRTHNLEGISVCVIFLIAINLPILGILRKATSRRAYEFSSILGHLLEVIGYTAIIYFLGGIRGLYISPLYAVLIAYLGVFAPPRFPFIVAVCCTVALGTVVALEYYGFIPHMEPFSTPQLPGSHQVGIVLATACMLFLMAFISSYAGVQLRKNRRKLREQYVELEERAGKIEQAEMDLRKAHQGLERRVQERTAELMEANDQLRGEIAERRRAEGALRESEEKYRLHFENVNEVIYSMDRELIIRSVSPSVDSLLGYKPEEIIGKRVTDLSILSPQFYDQAMSEIMRVFAGERIASSIYEFITKDGERKTGDVSGAPLFRNGKVDGLISVARDISARRQAEEARLKLESHLLQAQKMEAIGTLAGGIAHKFNNLLSVITVNLDLIEMDVHDGGNTTPYAKAMKDSARQMVQLTNQLLAYARGGKYQAKTISLADFVRDTLPLIEHTLKASVHVETDLPRDIMSVKADLTQMQMVLSAILSNASEAIEDEGRIRITCRNEVITEEGVKSFQDLKSGPYVRLTIEDDGRGMDEETRDRVFEPFFTTKFQGRGLGLAAVYGIVKNHDGWISVESELGKGTRVHIYLPAVEGLVIEPQKPKIDLTAGARTILLVEDEEMVMDVSRVLLERLGHRVLVAKTGKEAIHMAKTFDGDITLAILDVVLPDIGGKDLYPLLMEARPSLKVVVCSGYSVEGPAQEILDAGAQGFIQKPFSLSTISEKLKEVLGKD
jgi:two-component system cell cycle sensor histidine kinase/response regulator CckA